MLPRMLKNNRAIAIIGLVVLLGLIFHMCRREKMTLEKIDAKIAEVTGLRNNAESSMKQYARGAENANLEKYKSAKRDFKKYDRRIRYLKNQRDDMNAKTAVEGRDTGKACKVEKFSTRDGIIKVRVSCPGEKQLNGILYSDMAAQKNVGAKVKAGGAILELCKRM